VVSMDEPVRYPNMEYHYATAPAIFPLFVPLESDGGGVFARQEAGRLTITWYQMRTIYERPGQLTFQAVLYADGVFEITTNGLPDLPYQPDTSPFANVWVMGAWPGQAEETPALVNFAQAPLQGGPQGMVQDHYLEFRRYLHQLLFPLAVLIVGSSLFVIVGFPVAFYVSLIRPLDALLEGVRQVKAGDLETVIPVQYHDEIGFLAGVFNETAVRLRGLVTGLETRVAERTQALTEANVRLHAEMLEREEAQAQMLEQQRALAALEEREQLGRELHDGLGQVLGYINLEAQAAQSLMAQDQQQAVQASLERLAQVAQDAHADVRDFILGLRPTVAREQNLYNTLQACLRQFTQACGVEATLSWPEDAPVPAFAPAVEEQVLRILQEALTNVRKHAQAHRVEVLFSFAGDQAQVIVADDGVGFDVSCLTGEMGRHFGLSIMRERAAQVGGRLEVRSAPGQGSKVLLTVPRRVAAAAEAGDFAVVKGLRLLLVDDHPLFLDGLRNLLTARGLAVVGLARDGLEAQEQARRLRPDVIVMDVHMPRCDGLEATRAIKAELPDTKIVMLTVSEDEEHLFEAIKSGASGYLLKSLDANKFCALLAELAQGETPLAPGLAARILAEFARRDTVPSSRRGTMGGVDLTPQQREILQRVAQGQTYKEIGAALHLTERTVKYHMGQILERLHVETRAQAIACARRLGLDE